MAHLLSKIRRYVRVCIFFISLIGIISLSVSYFVLARTNASIYEKPEEVPPMQVALVLGASIRSNGVLSPVLQERADAALRLYMSHKVTKILVSGDNSTHEYNEVYPVGKYLVSRGVLTGDIFLDYAGFDTYSSMYRARNVFGVTSMIVTSQRFHLPRALFIAHRLGMSAVGLDASRSGDRYFENTLREIPATAKALYDLMSKREPQYLGPTFFVTGDASATWVGPKAEMIYFKQYGKK